MHRFMSNSVGKRQCKIIAVAACVVYFWRYSKMRYFTAKIHKQDRLFYGSNCSYGTYSWG